MEVLVAKPEHLEVLACRHDEMVEDINAVLVWDTKIRTEVQKTWGPLFDAATEKFKHAEHRRDIVIQYIKSCAIDFAAQLRVAADHYAASDIACGESLDAQGRSIGHAL